MTKLTKDGLPIVSKETLNTLVDFNVTSMEGIKAFDKAGHKLMKENSSLISYLTKYAIDRAYSPEGYEAFTAAFTLVYEALRRQSESNQLEDQLQRD